jgi:cytochrome P450
MAVGFTSIRADPLSFLEQVRLRYGDLVAFPVPGSPALLVSDPEAVRGILQGNARRWAKNTVQYAALATVTGPGLLAVSDDRWLGRRRAAQPAFHHGRLGTIGDSVAAAAATVVRSWQGMSSTGADVDVDAIALGITLDVVGRTLFDRDLTEQTQRLVHATDEAAELVVAQAQTVPLPSWVPTTTHRRLRAAVTELDSICRDLTAERRTRGVGNDDSDLLGLLIAAGLDDDGIRDELVTMVVAGHETVASALTWTLMLLAENPAAQSRLREEVRGLDANPTPMRLRQELPWTRAVIDESLRLFPPGWVVSRRATEPDVVAGQPVPAGTIAIISPWLLHRNAGSWPDPLAFVPERFLGDTSTVARPDYVPFGLGPRLCIGRDFALVELAVVLAGLLRDHEVTLPQHWRRPAVNAFVTLRPRGGLTLRVRAV